MQHIPTNEYRGGRSTNESYDGTVNEKSDFFESNDIKHEAINLVRELQRPGKSNEGVIVGAKLTSKPDEIEIFKEFGSVIVKIIKVIK